MVVDEVYTGLFKFVVGEFVAAAGDEHEPWLVGGDFHRCWRVFACILKRVVSDILAADCSMKIISLVQFTAGWGGSPPSPPSPPGPGVVAVSDNKVMVRFVKDYDPAFTGVDLRVYGPFEEGDILRMPKANAEVLESRGIVRWFGGNPDN